MGLGTQTGRHPGGLARILEIAGGGCGVGPVGAVQLVAQKRVGKPGTECLRGSVDESPTRLGHVRAQVDVQSRRDKGRRQASERVPDHDHVALAAQRVAHDLGVPRRARLDVLAGQVGRHRSMVEAFELGP